MEEVIGRRPRKWVDLSAKLAYDFPQRRLNDCRCVPGFDGYPVVHMGRLS